MVIAVCIIVWILCDISQKSSRERRYYNRQEEIRHNEILEEQDRMHQEDLEFREKVLRRQLENLEKDKIIKTTVREAVDEYGRTLRETITEEI